MTSDIPYDTNDDFILADSIISSAFKRETNGTFIAEGKKNQKVERFFLLHC